MLLFLQLGRTINIVDSRDVNRIKVKLNRRRSQLTSFAEWGWGELNLQDFTGVLSVQDSPCEAQEVWIPIMRRSGEQIGVLLVSIGRKFV